MIAYGSSVPGLQTGLKKKSMKKNEPVPDDEMLPHYDFRGGVRGKYAADYSRNRNLRVLAPELLKVFPDSESVNEALRTIVRITSAAIPQKISANTASAPKTKKKVRA
jgi:hypothetical protein